MEKMDKSVENLSAQVDAVSEYADQEISLPSRKDESLAMSLEELKARYPVRYEMYLKVLRAQRGGEITEEEKEDMVETLRALNNLDKYIERHKSNSGERVLRDKQFDVFEDIRDFLEKGGKEGYIKLPTGSGKTVIFTLLADVLDMKTLVVVPKKNLVTQTNERTEQFTGKKAGAVYQDEKVFDKQQTTTTYQSLVRQIESGNMKPEDYKLLILDEAHKALGDKSLETIELFNDAIKLGFTATPKYSENRSVSNMLETEIHSVTVVEAVEDGMISPFSVIVAKTKVDISSVEVNTVGEYSQADLEKAVNIASRNKAAVDIYKKMFNGQLALAYCCGVQHAADVAKEFNDAGIPAIMMSGDQDLSEKEKSDIFEKFSRGEIKVITNADILIEGFDEKRVGLCLNLRPTLSPVVAEQRGGRVLRLNKEEDPKKHAYVIDFLDENQNKDFHPITFAEIAGASVVYAKTQDGKDIPDRNTEKADVANIKVEGLEIVVDSEEVMRMVREMESQAAKLPPENWIKLNDFIDKTADTFILPKAEVRRMVAENKLDKPDSFGRFKSVDGYLGQYISPELQNGILDELGSGFKGLPKDYLTLGAMKHELQLTWTPTFKRLFEKAKELVPDGVVNRRGQVYLSKKFFETLRDLSSSEIAPEDWVTESALKKMGHNTALSDLLDDLKEEMPDEIKQLRGKKHGPIPHYSPAFVAEFYKRAEVLKQNEAIRLQKEKELEVAPKDWLDLSDIRIATGQSAKDLEDAYNKYASANSNDNLLGRHRPSADKKYENFVDLSAVERVFESILNKKTLWERSVAPEGWLTAQAIADRKGISLEEIYKNVVALKPSGDKMIKIYKDKDGKNKFFYHPDFVKKLIP